MGGMGVAFLSSTPLSCLLLLLAIAFHFYACSTPLHFIAYGPGSKTNREAELLFLF